MKRTFIASLLAAITSTAAAQVNVTVPEFTYETNFHVNTFQMNEKMRPILRTNYGLGAVIARSFARWEATRNEDNSWKVNLTIAYKDATLYVPAYFKRNECAFNEVYEHELEHVRIYQRGLERMRAELPTQIQQQLRPEMTKAEVDDVVRKLVLAQFSLVVQEHAQHDSPEEYERLEKVCNQQIPALTRRAIMSNMGH